MSSQMHSSMTTLRASRSHKRHISLVTPPDPFHALVKSLSDVLGPSSGLDSDDVDPNDLVNLMSVYTSNEQEWARYAFADTSRNYTRNLVDEGNGKSNLLIVVWNPGKGSPVHDHADAHCVMKILKGSLSETQYAMPDTDEPGPPAITKETTYTENEVTYISDQIGLHKIANASDSELAVSLHLYTPPHAANFGFNLFDEKTGKCSHIKQAGFFSDRGQPIERGTKWFFLIDGSAWYVDHLFTCSMHQRTMMAMLWCTSHGTTNTIVPEMT